MKYFIADGNCGTEVVFKMIGAKWKPWIIRLCYIEGGCSFSELRKKLPKMSEATLATQINQLIEDEILIRVNKDNDTKYAYFITPKTEDVFPIMEELQTFALDAGYLETPHSSAIEYAKKMIGSKWKSRIIWVIHNREVIRFNELQKSIEGLSHKMLTQQLNLMEEAQLIMKKDYLEKSPKVEYRLTELGEEAYRLIKHISQFCIKYELIKPLINIEY